MTTQWGTVLFCAVLTQLTYQGKLLRSVWLALNLLDSLTALRTVRPNGRRIGVVTRRKAMRQALICWFVYVLGMTTSPVLFATLGWVPLYAPVKVVVCLCFLFTRLASSKVILTAIAPYIKPYETPIDITIHLLQSLSALVLHFTIELPIVYALDGLKGIFNLRSRFVDFKNIVLGLVGERGKELSGRKEQAAPINTPKKGSSQDKKIPSPANSPPDQHGTLPRASQLHRRVTNSGTSQRQPLQPIVISPSLSPSSSPPPHRASMYPEMELTNSLSAIGTPRKRVKRNEAGPRVFLDVPEHEEKVLRRSPRRGKSPLFLDGNDIGILDAEPSGPSGTDTMLIPKLASVPRRADEDGRGTNVKKRAHPLSQLPPAEPSTRMNPAKGAGKPGSARPRTVIDLTAANVEERPTKRREVDTFFKTSGTMSDVFLSRRAGMGDAGVAAGSSRTVSETKPTQNKKTPHSTTVYPNLPHIPVPTIIPSPTVTLATRPSATVSRPRLGPPQRPTTATQSVTATKPTQPKHLTPAATAAAAQRKMTRMSSAAKTTKASVDGVGPRERPLISAASRAKAARAARLLAERKEAVAKVEMDKEREMKAVKASREEEERESARQRVGEKRKKVAGSLSALESRGGLGGLGPARSTRAKRAKIG